MRTFSLGLEGYELEGRVSALVSRHFSPQNSPPDMAFLSHVDGRRVSFDMMATSGLVASEAHLLVACCRSV